LVAPIAFDKGHVDVVSAIDGCALRDAEHARTIFEKHALSPVHFLDALRACDDMGADIYLQVAAGGPLSSFARGSFAGQSKAILSLASMDDEDGGAGLLSSLGRLFTLGVDLDLQQVIGSGAVASLPPTVLPRETYWCIKATPGQAPTVDADLAKAAAADRRLEKESKAPALEPLDDTDDLAAGVMAVVARVSAYPRASLKRSMTLMGALGFDSLMIADLVTGLSDLFEEVEAIPQDLLVNNPTVADLVEYVRTTVQMGPQEAEEKLPLRSFTPVWRPRPLGKTLEATLSLKGKTTLLVGGRRGPRELRRPGLPA
jgi:acyl transferase domain-containing protein